jgi:hypothetical protein
MKNLIVPQAKDGNREHDWFKAHPAECEGLRVYIGSIIYLLRRDVK